MRRVITLGAGRGLVLRDRPALRAGHDYRPRPALGPAGRRARQRLLAPGRRHDRSGLAEDASLHRALRHVPPADREPGRRARLHAGDGGGEGRHHPLRRGRCAGSGELGGALGVGDRAQGARCRRGRAFRTRTGSSSPGRPPRWGRCRSRAASRWPSAARLPRPTTPSPSASGSRRRCWSGSRRCRARKVFPSTTSSTRARPAPCSATGSSESSRFCTHLKGPTSFPVRP